MDEFFALDSPAEIRRSVKRVKAAFPRFVNWKHVNEDDAEHMGFAIWGEFVPDLKNPKKKEMPRRYFITFDIYESTWSGHLTIGQHRYLWTSADVGDAFLVDTKPCATLEEAIAELKQEMAELFNAFLS